MSFCWATPALPLWRSMITQCKQLLIQQPAFRTASAKEAGLRVFLVRLTLISESVQSQKHGAGLLP